MIATTGGPRAALGAAALALAAALAPTPGAAIVVNELDAGAMPSLGAPFDAIGRVRIGSGVCTGSLVSRLHVLTADHCIDGAGPAQTSVEWHFDDGSLRFTRSVAGIDIYGPAFDSSVSETENLIDGTDLAMLTLSSPVDTLSPFLISDVPPATGEAVRLVGYGRNGVATDRLQTAAGGLDTVRRGAENVVDSVGAAPAPCTARPFNRRSCGFFGNTANIIATDFDDGGDDAGGEGITNTLVHVGSADAPIAFEGSIAPGDSGGPLLIRDGISWRIAGVASAFADPDYDADSTTTVLSYGATNYWTGVSSTDPIGGAIAPRAFLEQFEGVIYTPLPGALPALALGLGALGLVARRRRRSAPEAEGPAPA